MASDRGGDGSVDSFLREIARAPSRDLVEDPPRIGRFRVTERLGRGGMGIVYRGVDETLRRTVAIKVLLPSARDDEGRQKRLLREARALASLTHPNVATIYEIGVSEGRVFLAMEYLEGQTLRALLANGPLTVARALDVGLAIASGLSMAHRMNVVHRDLKPENVMVSADGAVKILDFGLAKLVSEDVPDGAAETETCDGHFLGTPAYASPEQARGNEVGPATDVFAFGVTMYEMLTGRRPFEGRSVAELAIAMDRGAPKEPSLARPEISPAIDALVLRTLASSAEDRFADGASVVAALLPLVSHASASMALRAETPGPARSARAAWVRAALLAAGVAGVAAFARVTLRGRDVPHTTTNGGSASAAPSASAKSVVRMGDGPPPASTSPRAVTAYQIGVKEIREGSIIHGSNMLHEAVDLDPQLAAAHLRLCIYLNEEASCRRALTLRDALGARDRELFSVVEAGTTHQVEGLQVKLSAARARFPEDEEIAFHAAHYDADADGGDDRGLRALSTREAPFALADWLRANRAIASDPAYAWAAAEECITWTPGAASCLAELQTLASMDGKCDEMLALARRRATLDPESPKSYLEIAYALEATGAREALYLDAIDRAVALSKQPAVGWMRAHLQAARGNFADAEAWLPVVLRAAYARSPEDVMSVAAVQMRVLEELGDLAGAGKFSVEHLRRRAALRDVPDNPHALALLAESAHLRGGLSAKEAVELAMPMPGALRTPSERAELSALLHAFVADEAEARPSAITALAGVPYSDANRFLRARLRQAAGDLDGAAADYAASSRVCSPETTYLVGGRAELLLGDLESARKDTSRACDAYRRALARWGNAKPMSATADEARAKRKALGCAD